MACPLKGLVFEGPELGSKTPPNLRLEPGLSNVECSIPFSLRTGINEDDWGALGIPKREHYGLLGNPRDSKEGTLGTTRGP